MIPLVQYFDADADDVRTFLAMKSPEVCRYLLSVSVVVWQ